MYVDGIAVGKGTFGDVWKGTHKLAPARRAHERGEGWYTVAIKKTAPTVLDRRGGKRIWTYDEVEHLCQEVKTLLRLQEGEPSTSCILYLYEYYWTYNQSTGQGDLYLVTELLGQELDQWRQSQTSILESSVKQIASVLLNALDFLSSRQVAHRDLKLQNVLFRINGDFETLKIVDFGLAKVLEGKEKANDFCGSLGYIAPEIYMSKPYRYEVDMFAFGVMLFRLLSAQRPFSSPNPEKLRSDTINLRYKIEGKIWEGISPEALKLVRNLLIGPEQRYTAVQASNHRWFVAREDSVLYVDQHKKPSSRTNLEQHDGDVADQPSYSQVIALVSRRRAFLKTTRQCQKPLTSVELLSNTNAFGCLLVVSRTRKTSSTKRWIRLLGRGGSRDGSKVAVVPKQVLGKNCRRTNWREKCRIDLSRRNSSQFSRSYSKAYRKYVVVHRKGLSQTHS